MRFYKIRFAIKMPTFAAAVTYAYVLCLTVVELSILT